MEQLDNAKEANAAILIQKRETRRKSGPQRPVVLSMVASRGIPVPNLAQLLGFVSVYSWILVGFIANGACVFRERSAVLLAASRGASRRRRHCRKPGMASSM